ncbi:MAG: sulfite exporter TauE/SafE family protein [Thermicanus sp.]|nr:sulfite exporter TauE/SafE family protein [Thermicanus sp.]
MEAGTILLLFVIGLIAGAYGTIVGAGGGFIFVPALLLLLKYDPPVAAGTGLVVVLINALSGMIGYIHQKRVDYRFGGILSLAAIPGTFLGVWLSRVVTGHAFFLTFSIMLISLGIFLLVKKEPKSKGEQVKEGSFGEEAFPFSLREEVAVTRSEGSMAYVSVNAGEGEVPADVSLQNGEKVSSGKAWWKGSFRRTEWALLGTGFILGIISSFFGIGGGWLMVPILIYLFRLSPHVATATSVFSLSIYSLVGVFIHGVEGNIDWMTVLWGGLGVIGGSQFGVYLSRKLSGRLIIQMFGGSPVFIGATMIR